MSTKSTFDYHVTKLGIGRVSKGLLLPLGLTQCDLVEPSPRLISAATEYLGDDAAKCRYFCKGLQDFTPIEQSYDIIWMQWMIGYLTDDDLVAFLKRCAVGLRRGGVVVIKDNTCEQEAFIVDRDDASSTRSLPYIGNSRACRVSRRVSKISTRFPDKYFSSTNHRIGITRLLN